MPPCPFHNVHVSSACVFPSGLWASSDSFLYVCMRAFSTLHTMRYVFFLIPCPFYFRLFSLIVLNVPVRVVVPPMSRAGGENERQKQTDMEPTIPNPFQCQYMFNVAASFTTNPSCTHNKREALPNSVQCRTKLMRCAARKHQFIDINLFRTQRFSLCVIGTFSGCSVQRFLAT